MTKITDMASKTRDRHIDDLRRILRGSLIASDEPLSVTIAVANRSDRMNLLGILANIREGVV